MTKDLIAVFTKPWTEPLPALAERMAELGVDGVELPVRPGYQVLPEDIDRDLPRAVATLGQQGLKIISVAGSIDERTIAACGDSGIGIIRVCLRIDMSIGYLASIERHRRQFDEVLPALERFGVTIGVQNHSGTHVASAIGLLHLIERYDPKQVSAVLDMAHCALDGEPTAMAVDIVKDRLHGLVNFKSAYWRRVNGPEDEAVYQPYWTTHRHGGYSWREFVACLRQVGFTGTYCLPAEYRHPSGKGHRMGDEVMPYLREDLAHLKALLAEPDRSGL